VFGLPKEFLDHGSRGQVLDLVGLTPDVVANSLRDRLR
jgi:1-deoxy-D-xylulose-5-phosphate synthase